MPEPDNPICPCGKDIPRSKWVSKNGKARTQKLSVWRDRKYCSRACYYIYHCKENRISKKEVGQLKEWPENMFIEKPFQ